MRTTGRLWRQSIGAAVVCGVWLAASPVTAAVIVDASVLDRGAGVFDWDFLVTNIGQVDVSLVSIVDAPLGDPLITPTLTAPAAFVGSYDPNLGIVDFLEGASAFLPGTVTGSFTFSSAAGPAAGVFQNFQAIDIAGNFVAGSVNQRVVPEAGRAVMVTCGLLVVVWRQYVTRKRTHGMRLR